MIRNPNLAFEIFLINNRDIGRDFANGGSGLKKKLLENQTGHYGCARGDL